MKNKPSSISERKFISEFFVGKSSTDLEEIRGLLKHKLFTKQNLVELDGNFKRFELRNVYDLQQNFHMHIKALFRNRTENRTVNRKIFLIAFQNLLVSILCWQKQLHSYNWRQFRNLDSQKKYQPSKEVATANSRCWLDF